MSSRAAETGIATGRSARPPSCKFDHTIDQCASIRSRRVTNRESGHRLAPWEGVYSWSAIHHRLSNAISDCEVPRRLTRLGMTPLLSANRFVRIKTVTNVPSFLDRGRQDHRFQERRSTAALQNASEETGLETAATSWSAAVLRRFRRDAAARRFEVEDFAKHLPASRAHSFATAIFGKSQDTVSASFDENLV